MHSKEVLMQMKAAIIRLTKQNRPFRERAGTLVGAKSTISLDDHKIIFLVKKNPSQHLAKSRTLWRRYKYHCQRLQSRDNFMNVNTEGLSQNANY